MKVEHPASGALSGLRVLDCTRVLSGPICGRMLADMGADVVKVEAPGSDIFRLALPRVGGVAAMYAHFNVGKRNVGLDLKAPGGVELLARLAGRADVLLENFRPEVLARLGLGADALLARNPRLVYCSITGWGQRGPWAQRPAYAPIVHAEAGTMALGAALRGGEPAGEVQQHADAYAGLMACNAITAALFERERTGRGQHLDVAMGEALLYVNEHTSAELARYTGPRTFDTWNYVTFRLANGRGVHVLGPPRQIFPVLARCLEMDEALADPRFDTPEALADHVEEAVAALAARLAAVPDQAALEQRLQGHAMILAEVRSVAELADSDWARQRVLTSESLPGLPVPRAPWRSDTTEIGARDGVARRGEHNREVAAEWLGLDAAACERLEAAGVLGHSSQEPPTLDDLPRRGHRER